MSDVSKLNGKFIKDVTARRKIEPVAVWSGSKSDSGDITLTENINDYCFTLVEGLNSGNQLVSILFSSEHGVQKMLENHSPDTYQYITFNTNGNALSILDIVNMTLVRVTCFIRRN